MVVTVVLVSSQQKSRTSLSVSPRVACGMFLHVMICGSIIFLIKEMGRCLHLSGSSFEMAIQDLKVFDLVVAHPMTRLLQKNHGGYEQPQPLN